MHEVQMWTKNHLMMIICSLFVCTSLWAREERGVAAAPELCAKIIVFSGDVKILSQDRAHLIDLKRMGGVECDSWISVEKGHIRLSLKEGQDVFLGERTFAQIADFGRDSNKQGDQLILLRGQAYIQSFDASKEIRVATSNSRVRMTKGISVVIYNSEEDETQLTCLEAKSSLENKFENSRRISVGPGESTSLNFKSLRVVPSTPRVVVVADLKKHLADMHIDERATASAIRTTNKRAARTLSSDLPKPKNQHSNIDNQKEENGIEDADLVHRRPSGLERDPKLYEQYSADQQSDELKAHFKQRAVSEVRFAAEDSALYPLRDPLGEQKRTSTKIKDENKKALLKELSKIHPDED